MSVALEQLIAGQSIPFGGDRQTVISEELAAAFRPGDRLVVVQNTGDLLHIPAAEHQIVTSAVDAALSGFAGLGAVSDEQITEFFRAFTRQLADDDAFAPIAVANETDVASAAARGRSTTRLELTDKMRSDMIAGLKEWVAADPARDLEVDRVDHDGWSVSLRRAPLGVVAFVFEGRPNVFADACGVVRTGNSVVFRIGSDALGTARAIVEHALRPALADSGLPEGCVQLVDSANRSAGHALFSDRRLALAVARGSGAAVAQLGDVAVQSGIPVSLHGTGGAWVVAGEHADAATLGQVVKHSLDRKVCNTLNVLTIPRSRAVELVPVALAGLDSAAQEKGVNARLHVVEGSESYVDRARLETQVPIARAEGDVVEPAASSLPIDGLATEWEWERSPEITLVVVDDVSAAVDLCNRYSPRFIASLVSDDQEEHAAFYASVDAPFVGNGFTRWVDGQYAIERPELGLSNWEGGRLLGRGGVLSGDSVHTIRFHATVTDHGTHR